MSVETANDKLRRNHFRENLKKKRDKSTNLSLRGVGGASIQLFSLPAPDGTWMTIAYLLGFIVKLQFKFFQLVSASDEV